MEYLHIYLLVIAAISCIAAIFITKVINKKSSVSTGSKTYVEKYIESLKHDLERSRVGITIEQYFIILIGSPALLAVVAYFITDDRSLMLIFIAFGFTAPRLIIRMIKDNEDKKFETRFVRALAQMASSLHSRLTVEQAVDSVVACELLHPTIREDFAVLSSRLKLGVPISDAFYDFAKMTDSKDAKDVATAITIMTDLGGDAGVAIEKLQKNIADRLMYRKKRESMMTESKIIVLVADIVPLLVLAGIYVFMPNVVEFYFSSTGTIILFAGLAAVMMAGSLVVHKMLGSKVDIN